MTSISDTNVVNAPGGLVELGYSQITSDTEITSTTAGSGDTVISALTVVCDGSPIVVEFFSPQARPNWTTSNSEMSISLYEDGSEETRQWGRFFTGATGFDNKPAQLTRRLTPSAGIHTYSVKAYVSTGSGSIGGGSGGTSSAPAFLRVSKIIQASQLIVQTPNAPLVTSLPSNAIDGQEVRYLADNTNGIIWNFRYRAGSPSTYKWEFIGGAHLASLTGGVESTTSNSYVALATAGPVITLPLAGDYDVTALCDGANVAGTTYAGVMSYDVGGTSANDAWGAWTLVVGPGYGNTTTYTYRHTGLAASTTLTSKYKSPQSVQVYFARRRLSAIPVRVSA